MEKRLIFVLAPLLLFWHWFDPLARKNQKGIRFYDQKKYEAALNSFMSAKGIQPKSPVFANNIAATLYQLKKYKEAMEEFDRIPSPKTHFSEADLRYNQGNTAFRLEDWPKALDFYKKCLLIHPEDMEAKKNYELTWRKIQGQDSATPPPETQQQPPNDPLMQYLNQKEQEQQEKRQRKTQPQKKEKDW